MAGFFTHILFREPLIAVAQCGPDLKTAVDYYGALADGRPAHIFVSPSWLVASQTANMAAVKQRAAALYPALNLIGLAPVPSDMALIAKTGLEPLFVNKNAFLDERIYYPEPAAAKRFDAVYTGRLSPFKRHEFAFDIPRMAIVTGAYNVGKSEALAIRAGYRDLQFCNLDSGGSHRRLDSGAVRRILGASHCGLALSAVEGAMYAFCEYALCGLPQVTTPALGGREIFFDGDFTEIVDATPEATAAAVARLKHRRIDPLEVRTRMIARFRPHRRRMIEKISAILQTDLAPLADANLWLPQFVDKMRIWRQADSRD